MQWAAPQPPHQQPYAASPGAPWTGQPDGPDQGGPSKKSNRKLYAIIAAIVVVLLIGGGLFFFLSGDDISYEGREIVEPEKVLSDAEPRVDAIVDERNGATNDETACYFVAKNAETTDVEDGLVCGPVLFVDGDESQPYLTFPLQVSTGDGDATLTVGETPEAPEPAALADPNLLLRPDGATPPEGSGGLAAPDPPRAEEGIFTSIPSEGVELEATPDNARIGSPTMSVDVSAFGEPGRYGQGDEARRPAEGEKFVAFEIASGPGELGPIADFSIAVQVGDDDPQPLPDDVDLSAEPTSVAISVPEDADDVSLAVTEGALDQRLSLTTGEPDAGNVGVWQRVNRSQALTFSQNITIRGSQPGFVTEDLNGVFSLTRVSLSYFSGPNLDRAPSAPGQAFLGLESDLSVDGTGGFGVDPPFWSLTLSDGTVLPAYDLIDDPDRIQIVFEVPATFTEGTLTFGGVATSATSLTLDSLGVFLSVPISIPEG